jgi:hypothetical protein
MRIYYIDGIKHIKDDYGKIPFEIVSSPDENTPAVEMLTTGLKLWCERGWIFHRLTGAARIFPDTKEEYWLDNIYYSTIREWIAVHPNPDLYFDTLGMNDTDKVLWFLQN